MTLPSSVSALLSVVRWVVLAGFVFLALAYLNSSIYSAWVSGGPPNPYPLGWARRSQAHLSFSLAALFLGIGLFRAIPRIPSVGKLNIAILVIGVGLIFAPYVGRYYLAQSCANEGGHWSNATIQCER